MSGDDLLDRATKALRDAPNAMGDVASAATLERIERSLRGRHAASVRRRTYTRWIVMPMAASFLVFAAWASASGRLSRWIAAAPHAEPERAEHAPEVATPAIAPQPVASAELATSAPPEPSAEPTTSAPPEPSASEPPPRPVPSAPPKKPAPPPVDVDALYRDAHEAHFVRRDPAAALAAWDRYLAAAGPSGRFVLEARYNRAISLARLGRRDEAAAALRPFASGEYGGYRRDEAAQLLRTLE